MTHSLSDALDWGDSPLLFNGPITIYAPHVTQHLVSKADMGGSGGGGGVG